MDSDDFTDYDYVDGMEYADYYEDDSMEELQNGEWDEDTMIPSDEDFPKTMGLYELYEYCIIPILGDSSLHLIVIVMWSLIFLLSTRIIRIHPLFTHTSSALFGGYLIYQMFETSSILLYGLGMSGATLLIVAHYLLGRYRGPILLIAGIFYMVVGELFLINPKLWHAIRGIQMVILMKCISIGFDLDSKEIDELPNPFEILGYLFNPGTIVFGPWISLTAYREVLEPMNFGLRFIIKLIKGIVASLSFLISSTCLVNWIIPQNGPRILTAYRHALSFRTSHYFISYLGETSTRLAGIDIQSVTSPLKVEMPRSLIEVVVHWNRPLHVWLKKYVFKSARSKFGTFGGIILTYFVSALFHGLNFQLAAVLLSLAVYTYIEHGLRNKLAEIFNACILSRQCDECSHRFKESHFYCRSFNIGFMAVNMLHLAYLGMMFDSSPAQEHGYSMEHTLKKWGELNYFSHYIALFCFVVMSVL